MIIEWQNNIAGFAGNHQYWTVGQPWLLQSRIASSGAVNDSVTLAGLIASGVLGTLSVVVPLLAKATWTEGTPPNATFSETTPPDANFSEDTPPDANFIEFFDGQC